MNSYFRREDKILTAAQISAQDACLVRFECLKEIYQKGQAWPRRQEADGMTVGGATALVTRKELEDVMRPSCNGRCERF